MKLSELERLREQLLKAQKMVNEQYDKTFDEYMGAEYGSEKKTTLKYDVAHFEDLMDKLCETIRSVNWFLGIESD